MRQESTKLGEGIEIKQRIKCRLQRKLMKCHPQVLQTPLMPRAAERQRYRGKHRQSFYVSGKKKKIIEEAEEQNVDTTVCVCK